MGIKLGMNDFMVSATVQEEVEMTPLFEDIFLDLGSHFVTLELYWN